MDGIPLAIELAAARVKVLSVEQIAERLDDRFRLLTGGSRTALPRQQTLRALIDWSYQLLGEQERLLFRRLAVFVGGWTLEAAEAVCGFGGIESVDILDLLTHLGISLWSLSKDAGKEFVIAGWKLFANTRVKNCLKQRKLRKYVTGTWATFVALAEKAEIEILNSNQVVWLKRLEDEFANIRTALGVVAERLVEDGLRLGSAIWRFCLRYGYTNELVEKLNQLLEHRQGTREL